MRWILALLLAVVIFGSAALFTYKIFVRPELVMRAEKKAAALPYSTPDISLPEFEAAKKLKDAGKLGEARSALTRLIQKFPSGQHVGEAEELLGEVNISILLSDYPAPEKEEYIIRSGDVLARVASKFKTTPELIMRTNNLSSTRLRIGQKLVLSHPEFSLLIQRDAQWLYLLDHGQFFKRYRILDQKVPGNPPTKLNTRVGEIMAWKSGRRIGLGSAQFLNRYSLDPARCAGLRHLFRARRFASDPRHSATGRRFRDGSERRRRAEQSCQHANACHCCSVMLRSKL